MRLSVLPRFLMLAISLPLAAVSPVAAASFQDAATPPPATVPRVAEQQRIFDDLPVLLDDLGRVPVGRITFEPGATLSSDLIVVPIFAVVEKGTFEVTIDGVVTTLGPLDHIEIEGDSRTQIENIGPTNGSWVAVAQLSMDTFADFDLWVSTDFELTPGIVTVALAPMQSIRDRLALRLLSVDLLDIPTGMTVDSLDFDGSTATESLVVVVVEGDIHPSNDETIDDGEVIELSADEMDIGWRAIGAKAATLLIFRVAEAPED